MLQLTDEQQFQLLCSFLKGLCKNLTVNKGVYNKADPTSIETYRGTLYLNEPFDERFTPLETSHLALGKFMIRYQPVHIRIIDSTWTTNIVLDRVVNEQTDERVTEELVWDNCEEAWVALTSAAQKLIGFIISCGTAESEYFDDPMGHPDDYV